MAWWNKREYCLELNQAEIDNENAANFPDFEDWESEPSTERLRRIGARNILAGYSLGKLKAQSLRQCKWLIGTAPFADAANWNQKCWDWLLKAAVCVPVFVPVIASKKARLIRFDCVVSKNDRIPTFFPSSSVQSRHGQSVETALDALSRLEPDATEPGCPAQAQVRIFAEDSGSSTRGSSGSLGIALALWAGMMQSINDQHEAMNSLTSRYAVSGSLNPNTGHIDTVEGIALKAGACFNRTLIGPYANRNQGCAIICANTWEDAKERIAPSSGDSELGEFPACDVLIQLVSKQTMPLLRFAFHLKPKKALILLHSDNYEYSLAPAERTLKCLDENRSAWGGESVLIEKRLIDSRRLHLAEQALRSILDDWLNKDVEESRIVLNITGGNKLMTLAASNVMRGRSSPLMYLEFHEGEYSIIGWDSRNRPKPTRFIPEPPTVLKGFKRSSVEYCLGTDALKKNGKTQIRGLL